MTADHDLLWTTLGTMSGPLPGAVREQPANLLHDQEHKILVDCGDGATDQLGKAGVSPLEVGTVIISHLHSDHTAGLYGLLARRRQVSARGNLVIYGPRGTTDAVRGIQSAIGYLDELMPGRAKYGPPMGALDVVEVTDGARFTVGPVTVTAATNSHYGFEAGSEEAERFQSLSYRFDMTDRSIVYTGDTGPSENVERLAQGADLLVSEITDVEQVLSQHKFLPTLPPTAQAFVRQHFEKEHLSADEVGLLARRAGVGAVVLTHNPLTEDNIVKAGTVIGSHFTGTVTFADDLDSH
ncbi:MBL fold metallo-hydrolase [Streptomyces sp. NPDC054783]